MQQFTVHNTDWNTSMINLRRLAAGVAGASVAAMMLSSMAAGTASAQSLLKPPLHCGQNGKFTEIKDDGYAYGYQLYKTEGNTYYYIVHIPHITGWVPIGEVTCMAGPGPGYEHY